MTIPNSVISIGGSTFEGCSSLPSVTIPNSVHVINPQTFSGCSGLTSVTIPTSVRVIDFAAFSGCRSLTSVTLPKCSIGTSAFARCRSLTSVTIPASSIGSSAFWECSWMIWGTISNSDSSIGAYAFAECSSLTTVTIPTSVTSIGECAFRECSGLTSVIYAAKTPVSSRDNVFSGSTYEEATLYVLEEAVERCKEIDPWRNFKNIKAYDPAGIEEVTADIDISLPVEVYNLSGVKVAGSTDALPSGIYILRQGSATKKIVVE